MGHALTAIDRKRALVSEEVVELQFRVRHLLDELGVPAPAAGTIAFDRTVPVGEDIADPLQIAPSTFHQHVRAGQRRLMQALFEGATVAG